MYIGIDLALRKTGIVVLDAKGKLKDFCIVYSDPKELNDEALLEHNRLEIYGFLAKHIGPKSKVVIEGLAFGSPSPAVDLIGANHWIVRMMLCKMNASFKVVPPRAWSKKIITKEWLASLADEFPIVRASKKLKLTKEQVQANTKSKAGIKKLAKARIFESVPEADRKKFEKYCEGVKLLKEGAYDLADAYCLTKHIME